MLTCLHTHNDEGFALGTVMGAIALMTVIAFGGFFVSQSTLTEAMRVSGENRAYQAASSGFEYQYQDFDAASFGAGLGSKNGYEYGTWKAINDTDRYMVTVANVGADEYEMVSVGESQGRSETVRARFQNFNLWDMNISGAENSSIGGGAGFNGNGTIIGKIYCNGDFEWSGNGSLLDGPVFVRNGVFDKQSVGSNVGTVSEPVETYFDNAPIGQTSNMFVDQKGSAPKLEIPWPDETDMDDWREWAINDSAANLLGTNGTDAVRHASSVSNTQYNVFDGSLTLGGSNFGKPGRIVRLTNGEVDEANSGDVIAVSGSTLYVNGVIYVNGTLTIASSIQQYMGKGLLVARNGIVINGRLVPAAYNSGDGDLHAGVLMPRTTTSDCIGLASLGGVTHNSADWVAGATFLAGSYVATPQGAKYRGSIIANGIDFSLPNDWLATQPGLSANLPPGMPRLSNMNARSDWIRR